MPSTMCAKSLCIKALFLLALCPYLAKAGDHMIISGVEKRIIVDRINSEYGFSEINEFDGFEKKILAITVDSGYGVFRKSIYIYVKDESDSKWHLAIFRATNSSLIKITMSDKGIFAFSKKGKQLLFLSTEGLNMNFDFEEQ
ncbi:hypothetical protein ACO0LM_17670 [Undibacterium sp. Di26W]|uniref:hypothetical protein n=1 Tax=Undibacterium sp. Di26W TaxID=3413035 RepID=UPI003BF30A4F